LKTKELCLKTSNDQQQQCIGQYGHKCDDEFCSISSTACIDFKQLNIYVQTIQNTKIQKKIQNLIKTINKCPNIAVVNYLDQICVPSFSCTSKKGLMRMASKANTVFTRRVYCSCKGKHSVKCGNKYCASGQIIFIYRKIKLLFVILNIKSFFDSFYTADRSSSKNFKFSKKILLDQVL